MAQNETIKFGEPFRDSGGALHLNEGLWINEQAPDRTPLPPLSGGGGPGYGGWGLDAGRPRGTGGPSRFAREKGWRTVFGEEHNGTHFHYANHYAPALQELPTQIEAERVSIDQQASAAATSPFQLVELQQKLTTQTLQRIRDEYLQALPAATGFYGAMPFYKRYDSFTTRLSDDGAFPLVGSAEEWGQQLWATFDASVDTAYKLHIAAQKYQAFAALLPGLAQQVDKAELEQPGTDLKGAIERRVKQIQQEMQTCFDCLPNFLQHELAQATPAQETGPLTQQLSAYAHAVHALIATKQAEIPAYSESNPEIVGPLSKPQTEALRHLVDEQATRRAGPLWAEYHRALALTESIRYLQAFGTAMGNLALRAVEAEQLQARYTAELAAAQEAARQQAEAERLAADEAARQKVEAERLAAEETARQQAETERLAAEAERQRLEAERQRINYITDAGIASSAATITPIGVATFAIAESASSALTAAITAATSRMAAAALTTVPQLAVAILAAAWPSTLGNAERRYLISTPLSSLSPPGGPDLSALAMSSVSVDLPYLLAGNEDDNELGLYVIPGAKQVAVRAATFDSERHVYSLALDNPQRILTWTPASAPGGEEGSSTSLPPAPPGTVVYTGSTLTPVETETESYPALDLLDQERLIVTFPIDSGLPPILVVFKSPRYEPGVVTGTGAPSVGIWLGEETRNRGALIPLHIADSLRGKEYRDFDAFRRDLWRTVANQPELSKQFSKQNLIRMQEKGNAPSVREVDAYGLHTSFVLHHVVPISEGGAVYDVDNLRIVTPSAHHKIHYGDKP